MEKNIPFRKFLFFELVEKLRCFHSVKGKDVLGGEESLKWLEKIEAHYRRSDIK